MDEVEVKVVQLEVLEGELAGREDVLVASIPIIRNKLHTCTHVHVDVHVQVNVQCKFHYYYHKMLFVKFLIHSLYVCECTIHVNTLYVTVSGKTDHYFALRYHQLVSVIMIVERLSGHRRCIVMYSYQKYDPKTIVKLRGFQVSTWWGLMRSWEATTCILTYPRCAALSMAVAAGMQKSYSRVRIETR